MWMKEIAPDGGHRGLDAPQAEARRGRCKSPLVRTSREGWVGEACEKRRGDLRVALFTRPQDWRRERAALSTAAIFW